MFEVFGIFVLEVEKLPQRVSRVNEQRLVLKKMTICLLPQAVLAVRLLGTLLKTATEEIQSGGQPSGSILPVCLFDVGIEALSKMGFKASDSSTRFSPSLIVVLHSKITLAGADDGAASSVLSHRLRSTSLRGGQVGMH